MKELAYYNGVVTPYDAASVPLSDRALFFGDAVYDVIVGRGQKVYQLEEHLERLFLNAERIGLVNHPSEADISDAVSSLLEGADADDFLLYVQLSGDGKRRGHCRDNSEVNLMISLTECKLPDTLGEIKAITLPDRRHGMCDVKTTNLLAAILSVEEAQRRGADIAIFHKGDTITECSYANISLLKDGKLITHPLDSDILPGITQLNLIRTAEKLGIPCLSKTFSKDEMYSADAVMITSTTKLIKLCTEIDGIPTLSPARDTVKQLFDSLRRELYSKIG